MRCLRCFDRNHRPTNAIVHCCMDSLEFTLEVDEGVSRKGAVSVVGEIRLVQIRPFASGQLACHAYKHTQR